MRIRTITAALIVALIAVGATGNTADAQGGRREVERYLGGTGDTIVGVIPQLIAACEADVNVSVACFEPAPGETSVHVEIADAVTSYVGGAVVYWWGPSHAQSVMFCNDTTVDVPEGTEGVAVVTFTALTAHLCTGKKGGATLGTVEALFS
ncbi:MAG: hypothetical protein HYU28_08020 [Actinobacteria bacterium]|nr:hypothetical protein [Actinomycetota bacterium]